jgi:hypothetical protein
MGAMAPEFPIRTKQNIMDNRLIKQFGDDILSYRIRTKRQKKRAQYKDFEKYLIQLHREEKELYRQRQDLGWMDLNPAVQKGWKRFFVLRDDVTQSRYADFFDNILKKINTYDWSHRKDFKVRKRRYGHKTYVVKTQRLMEPYGYHFRRLNFNEIEKKFFHVEYRVEKWSREPSIHYVFNEPWRFELRVRPNIIDKVRCRDEVLEARLNQISDYLRWNDFRKKQRRILYGSFKWRDYDRNDEYYNWNQINDKPLWRIIDEAGQDFL